MARQSRSQMASSAHDPTVISPFITGMPPATPESALSTSTTKDITDIHFPSREICMQYVTTFFEQVHCIYWIYSPEQFYSQLDRTLEDGPSTCSPSWLCSLYSIFAIASALPVENPESAEAKPSSYYLSIAKNLSVQACDTADSESLRAVVLLVCILSDGYYDIGTQAHVQPESCFSFEYIECFILSYCWCRSADRLIHRTT